MMYLQIKKSRVYKLQRYTHVKEKERARERQREREIVYTQVILYNFGRSRGLDLGILLAWQPSEVRLDQIGRLDLNGTAEGCHASKKLNSRSHN